MTTLKFRYLKNVTIDLGDGQRYAIPYKMEPNEKSGYDTNVPVFNLDKVHTVRLRSEEFEAPEGLDGMPERLRQQREDEAWELVAEARKHNNEIRKRAKIYAEGGVIEIIKDEPEPKEEAPVTVDTKRKGKTESHSESGSESK